MRAGQRLPAGLPDEQVQAARFNHARINLSAAQRITGDPTAGTAEASIPEDVKACNFWLLSADPSDPHAGEGWFLPSGDRLPVVEAFRQWASYLRQAENTSRPPSHEGENSSNNSDEDVVNPTPITDPPVVDETPKDTGASAPPASGSHAFELENQAAHPINHYVLLPLYAWGAANWELSMVEGLLEESHPAIGFSLAEARLAKRVTVVGLDSGISAEALAMLQQSGCQVERLLDDGTLIAS